MTAYSEVARQLVMVRRRWKRTAALYGLAVVLVETIGVFSILLLLNWKYQPEPAVRQIFSIVGLATVAALIVRHVIRPLLHRIPDDRLALYVEEHDDRFEGALMTATEFGNKPGMSALQAGIVNAVVVEAQRRTQRDDPRRVVPLARLHKYGVLALVLLAAYSATLFALRDKVGVPVQNVVAPWQLTTVDLRRQQGDLPDQPSVAPIEIRIVATVPAVREDGSIRLPRGGTLDIEAALSRPSDQPVHLLFRPIEAGSQAAFEKLPMQQVEKINGYAARINDVSEDIELCVATGKIQSDRHRVFAYEPLVLNSVEITTKYADYLQLADRTEASSAGDVTGPTGSKITVKLITNRPVKSGNVAWLGLPSQPLVPDMADPNAAAFSFEIRRDETYQFSITDVDGQEYSSPASASVRAIQDEPPTVALRHPLGPASLHPMGEIDFLVDASDDFGLAGVDMVYLPHTGPEAREIRVPVPLPELDLGQPLERKPLQFSVRFSLQELSQRLTPGETISYYFEARDRKPGQPVAVTDLNFLTIRPYETWASLNESRGSPEEQGKSLDDLVRRTWGLHRQKNTLPPPEFAGQADELAAWMIDPESGQVSVFVALPRGWKIITPDVQTHLDKGNEYCRQAHVAIQGHDTGKASTLVRFAMGEQALAALRTTQSSSISPDDLMANNANANQAKTTFEMLKMQAQVSANIQDPNQKDVQKEDKGIKEAQTRIEEIKKAQEEVINKGEQVGKTSEEAKAGESKSAEAKPEDAKTGENKESQALAKEEGGLAAKTREVAAEIRPSGNNAALRDMADKFDAVARKMDAAADQFDAGNVQKAVEAAKQAKTELNDAEKQLAKIDKGAMEAAIADLESRSNKLVARQRDLREKTQDTGKDMPDGAKPNPQQARDLKAAVNRQIQLKVDLENFEQDLSTLNNQAQAVAKRDTAQNVADAVKNLKRGRVSQKMSNAVVELTTNKPAAAAVEQEVAQQAMEKVLASLMAAANTLASDWKSEAVRAKAEADRIARTLTQLEEKAGPPAAPLASEDRKSLAQEAAVDMAMLARHAAARDLADKQDIEKLAEGANPVPLVRKLVEDPDKRSEIAEVVKRVSNRIEAEMQARVSAEKLYAAQREEFPPRYRELVNKYYEALSKLNK